MDSDTLLYLYGIVPGDAPDPPAHLAGVEGAPVHLVRLGEVAAAVSAVPASGYSDDLINARLEELQWVGERGLAHERVLDWFAERHAVVPLSLFSLHLDESRLRERLQPDAARLRSVLDRLAGRREWGVKVWRSDAELARRLDELSPALQALSAEIEQAPPGRRFLLGKKREALAADELRRVSARIVHGIFGALRQAAERSSSIPLPAAAAAGERHLALHAAFLLSDEGFAAFQRRLGEVAQEFRPYGFEFEFTGPWPPYHFVEPDVG